MRLPFVVILAGLALARPGAAEACSCMAPGPGCQEYWRVPVVFLGRVESIGRASAIGSSGQWPMRRVGFTVLEAFRGVSTGTIEIRTGTGGGDCGYQFKEGVEYLVYASRTEATGAITTGICSRTRPAEEAVEDLQYARSIAAGTPVLGRISGTIQLRERSLGRVAAGTQPMSNVPVRLEKGGVAVQGVSGPQGSFAIDGLAPGRYAVSIDLPPQYYTLIDPGTVELLDPRACAEVRAYAYYDGHVSGRVVDASGRPLPGVTIELTVPAGLDQPLGPQRVRVLSGADGRFELIHVPPGKFVVGINTEPDRSGGLSLPRIFYPGVERLSDATRIAVGAGEHVELADFALPAQVAYVPIAGVVLDPNGSPAAGARVYLKGPAESDYIIGEPATTDAFGRFVLAALKGRRYRLFAEQVGGDGRRSRIDSSEQTVILAAPGLSPIQLLLRHRY